MNATILLWLLGLSAMVVAGKQGDHKEVIDPMHFCLWECGNCFENTVGASLFASNIGSVHFVGLAGSGAAVGISNYLYEINAIFVVLMLGWLFLPVYIASGVWETKDKDLSSRVISAIVHLHKNICGLTAVIWTDFMQTFIMIGGAMALMALALIRVGGIEGMRYKYERAVPDETLYGNTTCGYPRKDYFELIRDPKTGDIPWPGIFGVFINSLWYWCADQVIVQRTLASKNFSHAKAGTIFCGYLKFLPLFILVFPGMIARILFPNEVACIDPEKCKEICGNPSGCSNIAYPLLVVELMPNGARGLMLAVMLSALMSSLTSIFNSSSTVFTIDIWKKIRRNAKDTELMIVSRLCVIVLVGISIAWIPVIQVSQGSQLFVYIQQITSYLSPPVCAVYMLALLSHRVNEFLWRLTFWTRHSDKPRDDIDDDSVIDQPCVMTSEKSSISSAPSSISKTKKCGRRFYNWICGIEKMVEGGPEISAEEAEAIQKKAISIEEKPREAALTNVNCVILMSLAAFVWAFLAKDFTKSTNISQHQRPMPVVSHQRSTSINQGRRTSVKVKLSQPIFEKSISVSQHRSTSANT
ncbi:hypothetical protein LSH36_373g02076 [Paralvinella palmiformis]|uniref:Uncharacterized protein n=1 Tax=Paralvinella palmiformis TaxID=53620 RepID=A0AAD9MZ53_9ANNE|nr:hypothetical protein LSH36_373g02076 [Paralvinella palmiformis]